MVLIIRCRILIWCSQCIRILPPLSLPLPLFFIQPNMVRDLFRPSPPVLSILPRYPRMFPRPDPKCHENHQKRKRKKTQMSQTDQFRLMRYFSGLFRKISPLSSYLICIKTFSVTNETIFPTLEPSYWLLQNKVVSFVIEKLLFEIR